MCFLQVYARRRTGTQAGRPFESRAASFTFDYALLAEQRAENHLVEEKAQAERLLMPGLLALEAARGVEASRGTAGTPIWDGGMNG